MARFNLNVIIEDIDDVESTVRAAIAEFHTLLQSVGHVVSKSTLTSDKGQVDVTPPPVVEEEAPTDTPTDTPAPTRPPSTLDN
jgi:hypothetical protein